MDNRQQRDMFAAAALNARLQDPGSNGIFRKLDQGASDSSLDLAIHKVCLLAWKTADKLMQGLKH